MSSFEDLNVTYRHFGEHRKVAPALTDVTVTFKCQSLHTYAYNHALRAKYSVVALCYSFTL